MSQNRFNFELLKTIIKRDNCVIDSHIYEKITSRDTRVNFVCCCGQNDIKTFRKMFDTGAFCKQCMSTRTWNKIRQTNQEKYGVDNPFQSKEIRDKAKQSHIKKHGCEFPLQAERAKEKAKQTFKEKYNVDNPMQSKDVQQKAKSTNLVKYGVEHTFQNNGVKDKIKQTLVARYGVENPMMSEDIKEKSKITNLEKYGVKSHNQADVVKEKKKITTLANFGVENPMHSNEVKEKLKQSCFDKYGVENPMQHPEINDKSFKNACKYKEYIFPCGEVRHVQGYEPFALESLIKNGYDANGIVTDKTKVPEIWYAKPNCSSQSRYFPDIYIPSEKRIIEVKSTYTFDKEKDNNFLKAEACQRDGYNFEFWLFDRNGQKLEFDETIRTCKEN
jgi:hypothetical protein